MIMIENYMKKNKGKTTNVFHSFKQDKNDPFLYFLQTSNCPPLPGDLGGSRTRTHELCLLRYTEINQLNKINQLTKTDQLTKIDKLTKINQLLRRPTLHHISANCLRASKASEQA